MPGSKSVLGNVPAVPFTAHRRHFAGFLRLVFKKRYLNYVSERCCLNSKEAEAHQCHVTRMLFEHR